MRTLDDFINEYDASAFNEYAKQVGFTEMTLKKRYGSKQYTPLHFATMVGDVEAIKIIFTFECKKDLLSLRAGNQLDPLQNIAKNCKAEAMGRLLAAEDANIKNMLYPSDKNQSSILNWVFRYGKVELATVVLNKLTVDDVMHQFTLRRGGYTPLEGALQSWGYELGCLEKLFKLVIEKVGIDKMMTLLERFYMNDISLLHIAVRRGKDFCNAILKIADTTDNKMKLLRFGGVNGTPLHKVVMLKFDVEDSLDAEIVDIIYQAVGLDNFIELLKLKAYAQNITPLHWVVEHGRAVVFKKIAEIVGADRFPGLLESLGLLEDQICKKILEPEIQYQKSIIAGALLGSLGVLCVAFYAPDYLIKFSSSSALGNILANTTAAVIMCSLAAVVITGMKSQDRSLY